MTTDNLTDDDSEPESHCSKTCSASSYGQELAKLDELLEELLSVESENTIGGMWHKTNYERADNGDPLYRAEIERSQLIAFRKQAKDALAAVNKLHELLVQAEEALLYVENNYEGAGKASIVAETLNAIRDAGIGG